MYYRKYLFTLITWKQYLFRDTSRTIEFLSISISNFYLVYHSIMIISHYTQKRISLKSHLSCSEKLDL